MSLLIVDTKTQPRTNSQRSKFKQYFAPLLKIMEYRGPEEKINIEETSSTRYALVYGGCGALGAKCVFEFKAHGWWVASVDYSANTHADMSIMVSQLDSSEAQERDVTKALSSIFEKSHKLDLILCVAGAFSGGTTKDSLIKTTEAMWQANVVPSLICASIATNYMKYDGLLILTGAKAAMQNTPRALSYGLAKAAVIQFAQSLSEYGCGLPEGARVVVLLPNLLDTTQNRKNLKDADIGTFTPLQFVSDLLLRWASEKDVPMSGTLCQLLTNNFNTDIIQIRNNSSSV